MNRFQRLFADPKRRAFVHFFTLGDPTPQDSLRLIRAAIDAGADALELGLPFSDPVADGPTNQRSMARALAAGMTFDVGLELLAEIRAYAPDIPIGLLLYFNLLYRRGLARAHADLQLVGVDAIVSADLPLEESAAHEASLANMTWVRFKCWHLIHPMRVHSSCLRVLRHLPMCSVGLARLVKSMH